MISIDWVCVLMARSYRLCSILERTRLPPLAEQEGVRGEL